MKSKKKTETSNHQTKENSRSVRRTKTALRNSLIELMKQRSILRITVKEICDTADVGRSTFYAHYESHYDLLEQMELECLLGFEKALLMNEPLRKYDTREITRIFEKMLQFIVDNFNSIQILLSENGEISFQRKFIHRLNKYFKNAKKHYVNNSIDEKTSECYSVFFINGVIALIQHWLKNKMHIPIPDFAKMIVILTDEMR
jgi:AcrR family transcriptional regulator